MTSDLKSTLLTKKNVTIKPRYTFKKKFINVEGAEMVQLVDLNQSDAIKNTHPNYNTWSQDEILREMKEDFLSVSDEVLQ